MPLLVIKCRDCTDTASVTFTEAQRLTVVPAARKSLREAGRVHRRKTGHATFDIEETP